MTFILSILVLTAASVLAVALAFELRSSAQELRGTWATYSAANLWPFWVLHFVNPSKFSALSSKGKILAATSIACLVVGIGTLLYLVIVFAAGGGSL